MPRIHFIALVAFTAFMLAFGAGCGDDDENGEDVLDDARTAVSGGVEDAQTEVSDATDDDEDTPEAGGDEDTPSVEISEPEDGDAVDSGDVDVSVDVSDFDVVDKLGEPAAEGEGHVHFYMDVDEVPTTPGQPAVTAEGTYHAEATESYTWPDVPPGEHTFAVQLVNNDHTPLDPPVVEEVTVTVE